MIDRQCLVSFVTKCILTKSCLLRKKDGGKKKRRTSEKSSVNEGFVHRGLGAAWEDAGHWWIVIPGSPLVPQMPQLDTTAWYKRTLCPPPPLSLPLDWLCVRTTGAFSCLRSFFSVAFPFSAQAEEGGVWPLVQAHLWMVKWEACLVRKEDKKQLIFVWIWKSVTYVFKFLGRDNVGRSCRTDSRSKDGQR